jgi:hypothetical protein
MLYCLVLVLHDAKQKACKARQQRQQRAVQHSTGWLLTENIVACMCFATPGTRAVVPTMGALTTILTHQQVWRTIRVELSATQTKLGFPQEPKLLEQWMCTSWSALVPCTDGGVLLCCWYRKNCAESCSTVCSDMHAALEHHMCDCVMIGCTGRG